MEAIHPEDRSRVSDAYEGWLAGEGNGQFDATFRITRPDGETRFIHSRGTLIRDADGRPYRASRASEDVTEARHAEEALAEAKAELAHVARVTTMGQLAASIAHEVNQPLGAMVANAAAAERWLAATPPETARAREALRGVVDDGQRAGAVVGRVRALMKREPPREELVDLNEAIREVLALARQEQRRRRRGQRCSATRCRVRGDKSSCSRCWNLTVSAGGDERRGGGPRTSPSSRRKTARGVLVTVRDTGVGLDPVGTDRLFDPFYTTKVGSMGMGLPSKALHHRSHGGASWPARIAPGGGVPVRTPSEPVSCRNEPRGAEWPAEIKGRIVKPAMPLPGRSLGPCWRRERHPAVGQQLRRARLHGARMHVALRVRADDVGDLVHVGELARAAGALRLADREPRAPRVDDDRKRRAVRAGNGAGAVHAFVDRRPARELEADRAIERRGFVGECRRRADDRDGQRGRKENRAP
jgi:signal transduction histidine kinase